MAVSKRTRYEVLKRDNHTCRYCGGTAPDVALTVDHVTPVALGGSDAPDNLVAACKDCNAGKSSTSPDADLVADVAQDAIRWAAAIRTVAELTAAETQARWRLNKDFDDLWGEYCPSSWRRPDDWPDTLETFRKNGLPQSEIEDAFFVMVTKFSVTPAGRWRYFCGICWRKIDKVHEAARALLATEGEGV